MSAIELKKRLIDKIQRTDDENLLKEAYRLLELSDEQRKKVFEAKQQIKTGQFLTNHQADKEIDEWLSK